MASRAARCAWVAILLQQLTDCGACGGGDWALLPNHTLNLLQWNPHWECFKDSNCSAGAKAALNELLVARDVDFANLVEFEEGWTAPTGWQAVRKTCGVDTTLLIYNSERWRPLRGGVVEASFDGCLERNENGDDRPFAGQVFEAANASLDLGVLVVGAHYPHVGFYEMGTAGLAESVQKALAATNCTAVIAIADFNVDLSKSWAVPESLDGAGSSEKLLEDVGAPGGSDAVVSSELQKTCCANDGFSYTFDRVISNFGRAMDTTMLFHNPSDETTIPSWAVINSTEIGHASEFHKAIFGKLDTRPKPPPPSFPVGPWWFMLYALLLIATCTLLICWLLRCGFDDSFIGGLRGGGRSRWRLVSESDDVEELQSYEQEETSQTSEEKGEDEQGGAEATSRAS
eukprot:TRINITY_DN49391_c0_g1_i2.p1 TRINITY_DN49391_c0_g1~~TRINITY_DN49391_c0_g1_i2.p1  ORF type:complete len:460 (+),score=89.73 TRINITY_DN49391_c0_g1_i2:179-1381(+)